MGPITTDQSHSVMATLAVNTEWSAIDFEGSGLQDLIVRNPKEAGRQFTAFLKNGARLVVGVLKAVIDRTKSFDAAAFVGSGWTIWKGPADGTGLEGVEQQDHSSLVLKEIDMNQVRLVSTLKPGESSVKGEEKLNRLGLAGHIRLDAAVLLFLWENQHLIPESWKKRVNGKTQFIYFDGTILRRWDGCRYTLYLCWHDGKWHWHMDWLNNIFGQSRVSAVLAS